MAAPLDDKELAARRRRRNIALALALAAFAVVFYALTLVKLGPAVFERAL
jgi:uncharacterized protein involved in exopolysaccharide biosynthesis